MLPSPNNNWSSLLNQGTADNYYQIKPGDTFASISKQFNIPETNLQKLNNQLVTPPRGSYIALQPEQRTYGPPAPRTTTATTRQNGYTAPVRTQTASLTGANNAVGVQQPNAAAPRNQQFTSGGRVYSGGLNATTEKYQNQFTEFKRRFDLTGEVDTSILPQVIGLQVQEQLGYNADNMQALGYTYANGVWTQSGTTGAQQQQTTGRVGAGQGGGAGWVWRRKKNGKWHKVLVGRNKQRQTRQVETGFAKQADNAGVTPVTTLDVRLGSG